MGPGKQEEEQWVGGSRSGGRGVAGDRRRAVGHRDRGQKDGRDSTNTKQQTMTQTGSTRFDATLRGDLPSTRADTARRVRTRWLEISRARAGLVSASLKTPTNMKVPTNRYGKKARLPRKREARGGVCHAARHLKLSVAQKTTTLTSPRGLRCVARGSEVSGEGVVVRVVCLRAQYVGIRHA